jgi:3-phenylpropionate/trans-cinnamate dioxygenase ferredoxin subunit
MPQWITVAKSKDLAPGQRQCVEVQKFHVVLFNQAGELYAIENVCPHAGLPLADGALANRTLICPYHGYCFDIKTGRNIDYQDDTPVRTFPVRIEGDDLQIDLDAPAV